MPNLDRLRLWADGLDSGDYEQCHEALTKVDRVTGEESHCCLGVITKIAIANDPKAVGFKDKRIVACQDDDPEHEHGSDCLYIIYMFKWSDESSWLPEPVAAWLGLPDTRVPLTDPETGITKYAWEWNDEYRKTFPKIAAMIRHTFKL